MERNAVVYYRPARVIIELFTLGNGLRAAADESTGAAICRFRQLRNHLFHLAASTGIRLAPKRQCRRVYMFTILFGLIAFDRTRPDSLIYFGSSKCYRYPYGGISAAILAPIRSVISLPKTNYQVGQNEKNAYKRNSGRRVAPGAGRRPASLRSEYRATV